MSSFPRPTVLVWLAVLMVLAGCAATRPPDRLPELAPVAVEDLRERCLAVYPAGEWQFVHGISFSLPDQTGGTVLGVTTLAHGEIASALLTVEGLVLFEAREREGEELTVLRALPPFDKPDFAQGLVEDVRAIFRPPAVEPVLGKTEDGLVCRFVEAGGRVTDLRLGEEGCLRLSTFRDGMLQRQVTGVACRGLGPAPIPERLQMRGLGAAPYTLDLTLLRADHAGHALFEAEAK